MRPASAEFSNFLWENITKSPILLRYYKIYHLSQKSEWTDSFEEILFINLGLSMTGNFFMD